MSEIVQKLTEPDSLKLIVPVVIGFIAAIIGFLSAFTMGLVSPFIAKRTESHKLRTTKGFALLEELASMLHKIEANYLYFEAFWRENYGHHPNFDDNIANFDSKRSLFENEYRAIRALGNDRRSLEEKLSGAWVYLPEKTLKRIHQYLDVGRFSHMTDNIGLIDEYHEAFFRNLLDGCKQTERKKLYAAAKSKIAKTRP